MEQYKLAVIGGGPGGYVAAIRAARFGIKTVLIEENELGGTCLNRGCVPTKAMLHSCEILDVIKTAEKFGIKAGAPKVDQNALYGYKDRVVNQLKSGVAGLLKANGVKVLKARAVFEGRNRLRCTGNGEDVVISAENIILATGSVPAIPPVEGLDTIQYWTSDTLLEENRELPASMIIIGGGVIGVECATILNDLGVDVIILEMQPQLLPNMDGDIAAELEKHLKKSGITIRTGVKVISVRRENGIKTLISSGAGEEVIQADEIMIATGRKTCTDGLNLESAGITEIRGVIKTDSNMQTNVPNIYAIGDVSGGLQLAHAASAQGIIAVAHISGEKNHTNQDVIPSCVYTRPEISSAGKTGAEAAAEGIDVKCGHYSFAGNSKAFITGENTGFIKIVSDNRTGAVIGCQMIGPKATELISEVALAISAELTIEELGGLIHPHPTVSEAVMECVHDIEGLSVHKMPERK